MKFWFMIPETFPDVSESDPLRGWEAKKIAILVAQ